MKIENENPNIPNFEIGIINKDCIKYIQSKIPEEMQLQYKKTTGNGNCCIYAILQNLNIPIEYHHNFKNIGQNNINHIYDRRTTERKRI